MELQVAGRSRVVLPYLETLFISRPHSKTFDERPCRFEEILALKSQDVSHGMINMGWMMPSMRLRDAVWGLWCGDDETPFVALVFNQTRWDPDRASLGACEEYPC